MILDKFIEIELKNDNFLCILETLTRIGIAAKNENRLVQTCHILHKQNKYYIVHFKEMFSLDGKNTTINNEDIYRRNTIAKLLEQWGLLTIVNPEIIDKTISLKTIKIVPFKEKNKWVLEQKYNIGKK